MTKTSQRKNDGTGNPNRASLEKSREAKLIKTKKSDSQIQCPLLGDEWTRRGHCGTYAIDPMGHVWRSDPARLWPGGAFCWLSVCRRIALSGSNTTPPSIIRLGGVVRFRVSQFLFHSVRN